MLALRELDDAAEGHLRAGGRALVGREPVVAVGGLVEHQVAEEAAEKRGRHRLVRVVVAEAEEAEQRALALLVHLLERVELLLLLAEERLRHRVDAALAVLGERGGGAA